MSRMEGLARVLPVLLLLFRFGKCANSTLTDDETEYVDSDIIDNNNNPYMHMETLDPKYHVAWLADDIVNKVIFNVTVMTLGYVGFGISKKGQMEGADIIIGGVMPDGKPYFSDRHATGHHIPPEDASQDWTLIEATENATHTFLSFSRSFDTCDEKEDIPLFVHGSGVWIIWSFGESDSDIGYHYQHRGSREVYILDADLMPRELRNAPPFGNFVDGMITPVGIWRVWTLATAHVMASEQEQVMCSYHKAPTHRNRIHAVGFRLLTENETDIRYIHHAALHRCRSPPGIDGNEFFSDFVGISADSCFLLNSPVDRNRSPFQYCREYVNAFGIGAKPNFLPEDVGIPISEDPDEYFMVRLNYHNPESKSGIEIKTAIEVFYTEKLREYDGGMMVVGTNLPNSLGTSPSILIPPSSIDHVSYGICSAGCTKLMLPESGINLFATLLHSHRGRGVRLHQIREGKHLPWIMFDDNYYANNQPIRILNPVRTVLPGDTLMTRCVYDTTDRNGYAITGGITTDRHEMCIAFTWYYPYIRHDAYGVCGSEIRSEIYRDFIGIRNSTWSDQDKENIVSDPKKNQGLLESQVANNIEWTTERRRMLQEYQRTLPQTSICPSLQVIFPNVVHLPDPEFEFESISPESVVPIGYPDSCKNKSDSNTIRKM